MYFVLYKLLAIGNESWYHIIAVAGIITFIASNLFGIKQDKAQRLLGYSSVGQIGLLMAVLVRESWLKKNNIHITVAGFCIELKTQSVR